MAATHINRFSGILPRIPESLLPEHAATIAQNCDFAYGELRNTKDGFQLSSMSNSPKSLYTDDGLTFYTWSSDVDAVRSPMVNDTYTRMYFTDGAQMKFANRLSTSINGGPPGTSTFAGVPKPSAAPGLSVVAPNVLDTSKYTVSFRFHYEYAGVKYQEQAISYASNAGATATFNLPGMARLVTHSTKDDFPNPGNSSLVYKATETGNCYTWNGSSYVGTGASGTPTDAFPVLRMSVVVVADNSQLFDIYSDNSSFYKDTGPWSLSLASTGNTTFTGTFGTRIKDSEKETRAYVYTYVNIYGEEGPPSAPTVITTSPLLGANVTTKLDTVTGYATIKEIRIYRTPSGSAIAEYFYVGSYAALGQNPGNYVFSDTVKGEQLNESLASLNWYAPPTGLAGLMSLPNGILCAWKGNELWFSEPYKPHAWPPQYVKPLDATIVGGIVHGSGAVITTVKQPYIVSGVSPDSMTVTRLNVDQAGVSKWSLAVVDGSVMYASHDGLVVLHGGMASLAQGQRFFTRDVWRERYASGLSGMRFSTWDGRLVVFHGSGAFTPFMIRTDEADGTMTDLPALNAQCAFVSQLSDQFYYAQGSTLYQFNGGSDLTATWQSRELVLPTPYSFGMLQAVCTGQWTLTLTASLSTPPQNGLGTSTRGPWTVVVSAQAVTAYVDISAGTTTIRIPGGFESDRWKVKLTGKGRFRELRMARTGRELAKL